MAVYQKLVHVNAGGGFAVVGGVFAIPARDVLAAGECQVRQRAGRRGGNRLVAARAIDEGGDRHDLRQDVVDPERDDVLLRASRAIRVATVNGIVVWPENGLGSF